MSTAPLPAGTGRPCCRAPASHCQMLEFGIKLEILPLMVNKKWQIKAELSRLDKLLTAWDESRTQVDWSPGVHGLFRFWLTIQMFSAEILMHCQSIS